MRVSRPLSIQIEPGTAWTLEFSARTRSKYEDNDAAAILGFGSIILWMASACAWSEETSNSESNITATVAEINSGFLYPVRRGLTANKVLGRPYVGRSTLLRDGFNSPDFIMALSPHLKDLEQHR
jgi:hypothetical protein